MKYKTFKHINSLRFRIEPTFDIQMDVSSDPFTLLLYQEGKVVGTFFTVKTLYRYLLYKKGTAWMIDRGLIVPDEAEHV